MMKLRTARRLGAVLQITLLVSIAILIYFEQMNDLGLEIGLVAVMFCISMCMLFVSEKEHQEPSNEKVKLRN